MSGLEGWISAGASAAPLLGYSPRVKKIISNRFRKDALRGFERASLFVVCSSLYPLQLERNNERFEIPVAKPGLSNNQFDFISPPTPLTGVPDALAMAQLGAWLSKRDLEFELRIDSSLDHNERNQNLILFGSPTSNLITKEIVNRIDSQKFRYADSTFAEMIFNNVTRYQGLQQGVVIRDRNPWLNENKVLCVSGIGPPGTAAAVDFVVNQFDKRSSEAFQSEFWVAMVAAQGPPGQPVQAGFQGAVSL